MSVNESVDYLNAGGVLSVGGSQVEVRRDQQLMWVVVDGMESSCLDVRDPEHLVFEYMQQMDAAVNAVVPRPQPIRAVHLGGCACALACAWDAGRPGSTQVAAEINAELIPILRELVGWPKAPRLRVRAEDAADTVRSLRPGRADVIVRDIFTRAATPRAFRTREFFTRCTDAVAAGGLLLVNAVHGGGEDARIDVAGMLAAGCEVAVIAESATLAGGRRANVVIVGLVGTSLAHGSATVTESAPVWLELARQLRRLPIAVRLLTGDDVTRWVGSTRAYVEDVVDADAALTTRPAERADGTRAQHSPTASPQHRRRR